MPENQNENQQLDLNAIYGLSNCNGFSCDVKNSVYDTPAVRPSVEQLASYMNVSQPQMQQNQNNMAQPNYNQSNMNWQQQMPQNALAQMYQPITQTQADLYPTPAVIAQENAGNIVSDNSSITAPDNTVPLSDAITDFSNPYPVTRESIQYLNGFIRTQIGRRVSIDFLIGSNNIETKSGYLLAVAANYILINELDTNDVTACDFYNIKFIRFYY